MSMEHVFRQIETENCQLTERVTQIEAENHRLYQENSALEKALEKQKTFHRTFSDDVVESERIRNEDFKSEKRSLTEKNQVLFKENRQLAKDVSFYRKAFEELSKEDNSAHSKHPTQQPVKVDGALATEKTPFRHTRRQRQAATSTSESASASICKYKSSRELSKVSEKLFTENKKLKLKNNNLSAAILLLKKKNRQLENFKNNMINKKLKFSQERDELELLVESTKMKNKDTFIPEVLVKLGQFSM